MYGIAVGRKEIVKALHVGSWRTIQMWKKTDPGFKKILRIAPNNKPFIIIQEAIRWYTEFDKLKRKASRPG